LALIFSKENLPRRDFNLWREVLLAIAPRGRLADSMGHFTRAGHKVWPWWFDTVANRLYQVKTDSMDVYALSMDPVLGR
jgi:hypothetical protein